MKYFSYKIKLLTLFTISILFILLLVHKLLNTLNLTNVENISKEYYKNKTLEREESFHDFFYPYKTTLSAIQENPFIKQYLSGKADISIIQEAFLSIKKALPCLIKVRYIDLSGQEIVKIDGTPIQLKKEDAISQIVPQEQLQNKAQRYFVQQFLQLKNKEIGLSKIDLNMEYGKIVIPKQPTLRLGIAALDNNNEKKGIIVFNICLRTFFKLISKTTLYYVHLIDTEGHFLHHHNTAYGLLGEDHNYTIFDEFPQNAQNILDNDEYFGDIFFSKKISNFDNGQNIKIILEHKFIKQAKKRNNIEDFFLIAIFIFIALAFPLVLYFSKLPDKLKKQAQQDKFISKLTGLPNRLALMEDLVQKKFKNAIIILISINNIIKIQNTYGYEISTEIIKLVAYYLKNINHNHVSQIYNNNYHTFTLKYHYDNESSLKTFLKQLIENIEKHPFKVSNEAFEFLLEITIGVSDPNKLNNSTEELNEAENALEYALEKNLQIEIFSDAYKENIEQKKENILLAKKIKKSIEEKSIILHFQPIYNNFTEKIEKYEALVRMKCEDKLIYPDLFLPLAKQINQYNTFSYIVIDKACAYFQDKAYEFSINLSILDISNEDLQKYLFERIEHYGVQDKIVIEIVEQEGIDNYDNFFTFIKKLKELGCKVAIDDFGSGYSNFEYIISLSDYIDYLKFDGSLIKTIATDPKAQILIGSLKFLCDNLQIKTIAEFVEDEEILRYLQSIGIDYSQGYYIGKPSPTIH
jgi:c-di-GMP phosphodiesterase